MNDVNQNKKKIPKIDFYLCTLIYKDIFLIFY